MLDAPTYEIGHLFSLSTVRRPALSRVALLKVKCRFQRRNGSQRLPLSPAPTEFASELRCLSSSDGERGGSLKMRLVTLLMKCWFLLPPLGFHRNLTNCKIAARWRISLLYVSTLFYIFKYVNSKGKKTTFLYCIKNIHF